MKGIRKFSTLTGAIALILALLPGLQGQGFAAEKKFDHDNTGFILNGEHQRLACDACHIRGIFKGLPKTCESCHATVTQMSATKKPPNHMNTTNRCDDCHLESSWKPAQTDHAAVRGTCESCHTPSARIATSKPSNHIPSDNRCENCHRTTTWQTSAGRPDHTTLTNCTQCHVSGGSATTFKRTPPHITTSNNCEACHNKTAARWVPVTRVDHNEVTGTCMSCHESRRPVPHYPGDCNSSGCHTSTTSWLMGVALGTRPDHTTITNCTNCHISGGSARTFKQSPPHINTSNNCEACHNKTAAAWRPVTRVDHNEVIGTCMSCHASIRPAPPHDQTRDCNSAGCHTSTITWVMAGGKPADHNTRTSGCSMCHGVSATGKPPNHIPSENLCENCHNPTGWRPHRFTHSMTTLACTACHNATIRPVNMTGHMQIISSPDCGACHNTGTAGSGWTSIRRVDHTQIPTNVTCVTCHVSGGRARTFKSATHSSTSDNCVACHSSSAAHFSPYTRFDHRETSATCASCHNVGMRYNRWPTNHFPTTRGCGDNCHNTTIWGPGTNFDHAGVSAGNCNTCHVSTFIGVPQKSGSHFVTTLQCDQCHHITTAWRPVRYSHMGATYPAGNYPGDHTGSNPACIDCHRTNTTTVIYPQGAGPGCAGCHTNDFVANKHEKAGGGFYTAAELTNCSGACHEPGPRHRVTQSAFR